MVPRLAAMLAVSVVMGVLVAGMVVPFVGVVGLATRVAAEGVGQLPTRLEFEPLPQRSLVLDRRGKVLATFFDENRVSVALSDVAPVMRKAIVAIEDHRFTRHGGMDLRGTFRAFVNNARDDRLVQGGSSITQQLVKMTLVKQADSPAERVAATEQSYRRKFHELRHAMQVERDHDKSWILERYLNTAYFGDGAHGIEVAARHYFSRPASRLDLRQAALLAGLVKNPAGLDPTRFPGRAQRRRNLVLARMAQLGMITADRARSVSATGLGLRLSHTPNGCVSSYAPFFCGYVRETLLQDERLGADPDARRALLRRGGITVRTTVDRQMQRAAARAVRRHVDPTDRAVGALAMVEPGTGKVRALAQSRPMGRDRRKGQTFLNYVVPERFGDANGFQAGSTFKVFVLAAAIDQGVASRARIKAPPQVRIPVNRYRGCRGRLRSDQVWEPRNSTGSGTFDLYTGTQQSVNTFFAKLELRTGLCRPYRLAKRMGVALGDPDNQQVPSFALGVVSTDPLTMAAAYATFAARGVHCSPRPVTAVLDVDGERVRRYPRDCARVLRRPVADTVNDVLRGVQEPGGFGHGAGIALDQPSAGKTGTISDNRAVWFIGYTPDLAAAAMIAGVDRRGHWVTLNGQVVGGRRIDRASGSGNAGPIWGDAMKAVQHRLRDRDFVEPPAETLRGDRVVVPPVVGLPLPQARQVLRKAGLLARVGSEGAGEARGTVREVRPRVGATVGSGREVELRLSD